MLKTHDHYQLSPHQLQKQQLQHQPQQQQQKQQQKQQERLCLCFSYFFSNSCKLNWHQYNTRKNKTDGQTDIQFVCLFQWCLVKVWLTRSTTSAATGSSSRINKRINSFKDSYQLLETVLLPFIVIQRFLRLLPKNKKKRKIENY